MQDLFQTLPTGQIRDHLERTRSTIKSLEKVVIEAEAELIKRFQVDTSLFGAKTYQLGQFEISVTVPKTATWDQDQLGMIAKTIQSWGQNPSDYISTKNSVPETRYRALPAAVKELFDAARSVRPGKPKISFKSPR